MSSCLVCFLVSLCFVSINVKTTELITHNHQLRTVELFTANYARTENIQKICYSLYAEKIKLPMI